MLSLAIPAASFLHWYPSCESGKASPFTKTGILSASMEVSSSLSLSAVDTVLVVSVTIGLETVGFMGIRLSVPSTGFAVFFLGELRRNVSSFCPLKRNILTPS